MIFTETPIAGACVIDLEPAADNRGFFARAFDEEEFGERGLISRFPQWSMSRNNRRGILRGLHYQAAPHCETKLVRCAAGAIYDVIVDLRCDSPTYKRFAAFELSGENAKCLYVPALVAHGFQTLTKEADVLYYISEPYRPEAARGIRWNDEGLKIGWPVTPPFLSERDRHWPDFNWEGV